MFSHTASGRHIARVIFAAVAATILGAPASHAQVTYENDVPSVTVKYSDLNLATEEGSRALYRRLVAAAEKVCPTRGHVTELRQNQEAERCITTSVEEAVKQVRNPRFAELARSQLR
jgi:UrcA family protein